MQLNLVPHPASPPADPLFKVWASVDHAASLAAVATTNIWFGVGAPASRFVIPETDEPKRADELWRTTCFELYIQPEQDTGYIEFNFSPSQRWAAYDFEDYRAGMRERPLSAEPVGEGATGERLFVQDVLLDTAVLPPKPWRLGLSAILEEEDGTISYWALAHGAGRPDFHHPDGWLLTDEQA